MFLSLQAYEWTHLIEHGQSITKDNFGATFFILTGFHGCHVFSGVVYLSCILVQALRGTYDAHNNNPVEIVALYWHFVDLVWILVFTFVYLLAEGPIAGRTRPKPSRTSSAAMQVFAWLAFLTAVEIGMIYLPISRVAIGCMLVVLAATKAALVALFYMHLAVEKRTLAYIALTPAFLCVLLIFALLPDLGGITRALTHATPNPAAHQPHHD